MIDHDTVQKIIDTSQILDVVQDFVTLKKRGVNYLGLCPFHNEKTPSFTVSPAKGIYKCFGCGEAGNAVQFIMKHEHLTYPDSLKYLAKKYHIEVVEKAQTSEEIAIEKARESLLIVTSFAQKYFSANLLHHVEGKAIGYSYFKERGFSDHTIEQFQLGYSLEQRNALTNEALGKGYKIEFLEKTGLTIVKDNYQFDRFSGRVIFPIHSLSGRVIAFGGRILKTDKSLAKYLNSPESEIYHKSNILYGIYFAKNAIVKHDKCYMVEGYTDMISLFQAGVENVVASSGTSLTVNQIRLVKRFTTNLTIIYDGDAAGIKASLRGIDMVLEEGMNIKVILLPDGEDPDSFAKKNSSSDLNEFIAKNEENFITFKTRLLLDEAKADPIKRATLITDIVRSIAIIPDSIVRSVYIKECSGLLEVKENALYDEIGKIIRRRFEDERRKGEYSQEFRPKPVSTQLPAFIEEVYSEVEEKEIIYFLLNFGNEIFSSLEKAPGETETMTVAVFIIGEIQNENLEMKNLVYKQIFQDYKEQLLNGYYVDEKYFINHTDEKIRQLAANLLSNDFIPSKLWEKQGGYVETPNDTFRKDIPKLINAFKLKIIQQAIEKYDHELKNIQGSGDLEQELHLLQVKTTLNEYKIKLAKETGERTIL